MKRNVVVLPVISSGVGRKKLKLPITTHAPTQKTTAAIRDNKDNSSTDEDEDEEDDDEYSPVTKKRKYTKKDKSLIPNSTTNTNNTKLKSSNTLSQKSTITSSTAESNKDTSINTKTNKMNSNKLTSSKYFELRRQSKLSPSVKTNNSSGINNSNNDISNDTTINRRRGRSAINNNNNVMDVDFDSNIFMSSNNILNKQLPPKIIQHRSFLELLCNKNSTACRYAAQLFCTVSSTYVPLQTSILMTIMLGFYYGAHKRRIGLDTRWKDGQTKAQKLKLSLLQWLVPMGFNSITNTNTNTDDGNSNNNDSNNNDNETYFENLIDGIIDFLRMSWLESRPPVAVPLLSSSSSTKTNNNSNNNSNNNTPIIKRGAGRPPTKGKDLSSKSAMTQQSDSSTSNSINSKKMKKKLKMVL